MSLENLIRYEIYHYMMDALATHLDAKTEGRNDLETDEMRRTLMIHDACVSFINQQLGNPIKP